MRILVLEPYFTGSHKAWALGYQRFSRHEVQILSLPGQFWKWRMHGGAVSLAARFKNETYRPDLLLATDMLDLTTFLALTRKETQDLPVAVYFHENQLSYPWSPDDRDVQKDRDKHYGFINYVSALAADAVFFNSQYNMASFLQELGKLLNHFPDFREKENIDRLSAKSKVLPLGLDLGRFSGRRKERPQKQKPLILWNHRWEFDKNPREFFQALRVVAAAGADFELALLGECFSDRPQEFETARKELGDKIVHFGYIADAEKYDDWLCRADLLPVTSRQDFFGGSVVEAVAAGCRPLLPKRLAYPELIPNALHPLVFYDDFGDLTAKLAQAVENPVWPRRVELQQAMRRFDWRNVVDVYDTTLADLC